MQNLRQKSQTDTGQVGVPASMFGFSPLGYECHKVSLYLHQENGYWLPQNDYDCSMVFFC